MSWNGDREPNNSEQDNGVSERGFTLTSDGRPVPGIYWSPVDKPAEQLVLLGHGGTADKKADYIEQIAHGLCGQGIAAMAIDGPGHGDRPGAAQWSASDRTSFARRWESDGGTSAIVADWKAALDFIEGEHGALGTGYLGLSMGTMMGLPLCVADSRIQVAVLGLMGFWGPNKADLQAVASELLIPVRFLMQWDDEVVPRDRCLELFDALGTSKKTLHANPGIHVGVPTFEMVDAVSYLQAQLAKQSNAAGV